MGNDGYLPLFETSAAKGRPLYWFYALSMLAGIVSICVYRWTNFPPETGLRAWSWIGISLAELWFIFYWVITQVVRSHPIHRHTFKDRLSERYEEVLPGVDIFVCTADSDKEPPVMVVNTVLSMMAYDYPPEKLHVYLSDDGASELMFYGLAEASKFAGVWVPFCRRFHVEPRAPSAYFGSSVKLKAPECDDDGFCIEWENVKKLYDEMNDRINESVKLGRVPDDVRRQYITFREWELGLSSKDHQTILEVLIDGGDAKAVDADGKSLPTLVYLAREKRTGYPHNFKAGAMNALLRVSSRISNCPIILNVDCDQYSNSSQSLRDVLCFFMDDEQSQNIAYVQYPQYCEKMTRNDLYGSELTVINAVEHPTADSNGGPLYIGTGCFHRRDVLCGRKYDKESRINWNQANHIKVTKSANLLETCKILASCTYEENSPWGKEMGLKYGCPVEDVITGLSIQCRGWRSVSFNSERRAFYGVPPTSLLEMLIQHMRWSTGNFQIFLSKYCSLVYGHGKIPLKLQLTYCCYNLWAANCLATLYYVVVPQFCLLKRVALFPQLSSYWLVPYAYVFAARQAYSLGEFVWAGGTVKGWYNDQRMWVYKRVTSYLYGFGGTIMRQLGLSKLSFEITAKISDDDSSRRYKQEVMEFGADSSMFVILASIAVFNLFSLVSVARNVVVVVVDSSGGVDVSGYAVQMMLAGLIVVINIPVFEGMFVRMDKGAIPATVVYKSLAIAGLAYFSAIYYTVDDKADR